MANGGLEADIEDLIGTPGKPDRIDKAARVLTQLTTARRRSRDDETPAPANYEALHEMDVQHGVTVGLLSKIFRMDPTTVKKKLRDCPPIMQRKAGYIYDLKAAAQFLVTPIFDAGEYLKNMKASELPTHLQDEYWSAQVKRQKWEENAGHLWRTESVIEVLGDVMQKIKFAMQLWPDNVERAVGLSHEQRTMLISMADELQKEVHKGLMQMKMEKATPSTLAEHVEPPIRVNGQDDEPLI